MFRAHPHSRGFGENGTPRPELTGASLGMQWRYPT